MNWTSIWNNIGEHAGFKAFHTKKIFFYFNPINIICVILYFMKHLDIINVGKTSSLNTDNFSKNVPKILPTTLKQTEWH